jgi:hypothetical protein
MIVDLICRDCGNVYRSDEGRQYTDPPYNWAPGNGYCLACWICPGWHEDRRPQEQVERN